METIKEDKKIPEFLQDIPTHDALFEMKNSVFKKSPLTKPYFIISAVWFVFIFFYIQFSFGWDSLSALMPDEFIRFLASAIVPLLLILLLTALVYKTYISASQSAAMEEKLGHILYSDNSNALKNIINQSLQNQIKQLADTATHISLQNDLLKKELSSKAADFEHISEVLEGCFSKNLLKLNENIQNLLSEYKNAAETAEQFSVKADELKNSAASLSAELNPLINETVSTADYLKNIIHEGKDYIEKHAADMQDFAQNNQANLQKMTQTLEEQTQKLEKTFLQTADSCEQIYQRLDGGISHVENSLKTHKKLAAEQSELLDKNSAYLDGKLGEYGKLISMEVEAMIERSSTLDINVENQLKSLSKAGNESAHSRDGANNSLEQKSVVATQNIGKILGKLEQELTKLNDFIEKTENKNLQIQKVAEKITDKIGGLSTDLGLKVDDLKIRAVDAIDKFNEVSAVVQKNTLQLSESANIIVNKGKEGSKSLEQQHASIIMALEKFEDIKNRIEQIEKNIVSTSANSENAFTEYEKQVKNLATAINEQVNELDKHKIRSERHLAELKQRYDAFSMANFMNESSQLVTKLENLSVDINGFFNASEEDELWKKFYNGDHAVFARNIVKKLNRKQIVKIRDEYEKNADFRILADKYIADFETLVTSAQNAERSEVVLAMISGADIGKIYYVIARAIDRLK
ncbi:MAG: hypothetical protein IJW75_02385 [Alphaproteobacteria bacterium]|nr:hypothetical protein [Alphaproteobacteria bacterium]